MSIKFSKFVRVATLPCFVTFGMLLILLFYAQNAFLNISHFFMCVTFLCVFPMLSYILSYIVPFFKNKGRNFQRVLAIIFSVVGYLIMFVIAIISKAPAYEKVFCSTYFISVLLLIASEIIFKKKASGHICSVIGPILMLCYSVSYFYLFGGILVALVWNSSTTLCRHTPTELAFGMGSAIIAFFASILLFAI